MKENEMSASELAAHRIKTMPNDKEYKDIPDLPIPLHYGVLIRELPPPSIVTMESGLILSFDSKKNDTVNVGILYAVGPKCSPELRIGIRVGYTKDATERFWHKGVAYVKTDELGVFYAIPDPTTVVQSATKTDKQVSREKSLIRQDKFEDLVAKDTLNEKDKYKEELKKKKIYKA